MLSNGVRLLVLNVIKFYMTCGVIMDKLFILIFLLCKLKKITIIIIYISQNRLGYTVVTNNPYIHDGLIQSLPFTSSIFPLKGS